MLISPAYAQTAAAPGGGDILSMLMPFILIFAIMYFLMIRPQQKKHKEHQAKLAAAKRGDQVITGGGIYGTVRKVSDDGRISIEISKDVQVDVLASTLTDVLTKKSAQDQPAAEPQSGGILSRLFGGKKSSS